jgi:hypothetical protein
MCRDGRGGDSPRWSNSSALEGCHSTRCWLCDSLGRVFGFHPVNLAFRFVLEIAALIALGVGAYSVVSGPLAWVSAIAVPTLAAVAWGTFNVPGDQSRSGEAPVAVPGTLRLIIELTVFGSAVVLVSFASSIATALLGGAVAIHYLFSIDRVRWLLTH